MSLFANKVAALGVMRSNFCAPSLTVVFLSFSLFSLLLFSPLASFLPDHILIYLTIRAQLLAPALVRRRVLRPVPLSSSHAIYSFGRCDPRVFLFLSPSPVFFSLHLLSPTDHLLPTSIYISTYLHKHSSSHLPSCADECFDLCLLLQYVATLHWRHVMSTSARSLHLG
jgi:hypothetical protein